MAELVRGHSSASTTPGGFPVVAPEVVIRNSDSARTVYLSHDDTTLSSVYGYPLLPGETLRLTVDEPQNLYYATEAGNARIDFFYYEV